MKIDILTNFQNEEWLTPLFLNHYDWADRIIIVLEPSTNDGTRDEISKFKANPSYRPCIEVIEHAECGGLIDDINKAAKDNEIIHGSKADWLFRVDSDEFVFPNPYGRNPRKALAEVPAERLCVVAAEWQVYRHETDVDVDRYKHPVPQRIHGDPDQTTAYNEAFVKPCIMRPSAKPDVGIGCHLLSGFNGDGQSVTGGKHVLKHGIVDPRIHREFWSGAHWCRADPEFAIKRRVDNRILRLGGWNKKFDTIARGEQTREQLVSKMVSELTAHRNDPIVIKL